VFRFSQEKIGPYWFVTDMHMRIDLRRMPLMPMPDNIELRVQISGVVINGQDVTPENAVPEPVISPLPGGEILPEPDGFWLTPEASADSLDTFWGGIATGWEEDLTPELEPITLTPLEIDSLRTFGDEELTELRKANWKAELRLLQVPEYNRVQGLTLYAGGRFARPGPHRPRLDARGGYGFSNERWLFDAEFDLPLVVDRSPRPSDRGGLSEGSDPRRRRLGLTVTGTKHWLGGAFILRAGGGWYEQRRLEQTTSWNLLGRQLRPDGNLEADALNERRLWGGLVWGSGPLSLDGTASWRRATDASFLATDFLKGGGDFLQLEGGGRVDLLDGLGNQWVLKGRVRDLSRAGSTDIGQAGPTQWKTWLGDHGTLRGHRAGELTGDGGAWASLDVRPNWDLFHAIRFPVLKKWGLQPHVFGDWGRTWDNPGPDGMRPGEGERGSRANLGFGFGRNFDLPGLGEFKNLRLHAAHPVGEGSDGKGWRVLLAFEK
jgi:hypothetical protein